MRVTKWSRNCRYQIVEGTVATVLRSFGRFQRRKWILAISLQAEQGGERLVCRRAMKNQTPYSGRRLRRAALSTLSAAVLCTAASLYAQTSSDTAPRTGADRSRTGTGSSTSGATSGYGSGNSSTGTSASSPSSSTSSSSADSSVGSSSTGAFRSSQATDGTEIARADRRFVTKAAELNTEEIRLSEIAAQQATNPEVRSFAQQLVTEHTQAGTELSNIISRKGLSAMARDDYDQRAINRLSKKSGADFDKAYIEKMVDAHDDAVDLFEKAARNAKDPEIQAFASKTLPKLQQHQQHAKSLEKAVK
jgi:putative membrane protein